MLISEKHKIKAKRTKLRNIEYYNLTETFDKLYQDSQKGKKFKNLMDIITSIENIELAYRNLKSNTGSKTSGTDKKNIKHLEKIPREKFVEIVKNKFAYYKPKTVKRVDIPKPNGKTRPLGIPTIWDRVIQQCILQILEPICEAKFFERNNGFRPNRSVEHAMAQCYKMINQSKLYYVIDIDIEGFFDNVNHSKLKKQLWAMGIQDKRLICIIGEMLKAPIEMPDGKIVIPNKGTPQGGILSPLLSNVVLNELDWWVASQWEEMPTRHEYKGKISNGKVEKSSKYRALRSTNLKEMYIIRYADDFKIFCRNHKDAKTTFIAVEKWLTERLKLSISKSKSKIINLKKSYSEFLGFKMKAMPKGNSYVVKSHMSDKAIQKVKDKLTEQIKKIQRPANSREESFEIRMYNTMVLGIHNYYRYATMIAIDCNIIHDSIRHIMKHRLKPRLEKNGPWTSKMLKERYGTSRSVRFYRKQPLIPISYVQHKKPMYKKSKICQYTKAGREEIHKNLNINYDILMKLMRERNINNSIEYMDNRISLYCGQQGKCAITKNVLDFDDIHCHHRIPKELGGNDKYKNLIIVHKEIHYLIHATQKDIIMKYMSKHKLDKNAIKSINRLREKVGNVTLAKAIA